MAKNNSNGNSIRSRQIKNKKDLIVNYPEDLVFKQQKYQSVNKFIKQYKANNQQAINMTNIYKIESMSGILKISHNEIESFHCSNKFNKDKVDMPSQKQQSRSTQHRIEDQVENYGKSII